MAIRFVLTIEDVVASGRLDLSCPSIQVIVGIRFICRSTAAVIANDVAKVIGCQVLYGIGHKLVDITNILS